MLTTLGILTLLWLGSGALMMIELKKTPIFPTWGKRRRTLEKTINPT
ncbi:hypothetical protein [Geminisphaera colitermitum]|nr:hypothetical protein [Geminisphaera colitermitum]